VSSIFVIGATGKVGRNVVRGLLERGAAVRALARDPVAADLPSEVEVVSGDLSEPATLEDHLGDVVTVFLVWPYFDAEGADQVVQMVAGRARRVVYLSAEAARHRPDSFWARVERIIERSATEWTFLRPTGFAANTLMWADQIRDSGTVRWPYGQAARSLVHERDIADVAVRALSDGGHAGERYVLTGPEALTQVEQVRQIGAALSRPIHWEELSREDAERELAGRVPSTALDTWASFVQEPEVVTSTFEEITGRPARSFARWARDHAADFG
jgi:uncharacterized protein YbjT (DUF2867 family)